MLSFFLFSPTPPPPPSLPRFLPLFAPYAIGVEFYPGYTRLNTSSRGILASGVSAYSPVRNALWAWPRKKVSTKSFWTPSWNILVHSVSSLLGPLVIVEPYRFKF